MSCDNNKYNFKTRTGHKVWSKTVDYPLATASGKFEMRIKDTRGVQVETLTEDNGKLCRISETTFEIREHNEMKPNGTYLYNLCYIEDALETFIVEGTITVSKD